MKKIILKVRQKGLMFNLDGKSFRSPVEVDITHLKIDPIISKMRANGVTDYEISTIEKNTKNKNNPLPKVIILEGNNNEIDRLNSKIEKLESILNEVLKKNEECNKEKEWEQNNKDVVSPPKKKQEDEVEPNKKPVIEEITEPEIEAEPEKIEVKKVNSDLELSNKKVIIEELVEVDDDIIDINLELKAEFKTKDFKYEEIKEPFKISSDIEKLKKYKK